MADAARIDLVYDRGMRGLAVIAPLIVVGCSFDGASAPGATATVDAPPGSIDASVSPCMQRWYAGTPEFGQPVRLAALASSDAEEDPWLTLDEKRIVFVRVANNG